LRTEKKIIDTFKRFSEENEWIRAAVLTSSRVNPMTKTDFLSDFDIEMFVNNIDIIKKNDDWLKPFGEILVRWPFYPKATFNNNWITRLILFKDGNRIDFQITDNKTIKPVNYDYGLKILIDKDNILKDMPKPTFSFFNIKKPSEDEYTILVNEFWWNATYVPKYLWRDELPFAKTMMGQSVHDKYLHKIIEWYIGSENNWDVNTGTCGRYFKKFLSKENWKHYEETHTGANLYDNWESFFKAVDLFSKLARKVGKKLGYIYPVNLEKEMKSYYQKIRNTKRVK